jgi:multiple sugar transport system permease protein
MNRVRTETLARFTLGILVTAIYLLPLFWMVSTSLKPPNEVLSKPPLLLPTSLQIDSYRSVLGLPTNRPDLYINAGVYFKNSMIIALSTTLLVIALAVPAAYALSRFRFRGRSPFLLFMLVAQMLPSVLLVIPLFVLFSSFGLTNKYLGVILADTALALPFGVIVLHQLPADPAALEEAARSTTLTLAGTVDIILPCQGGIGCYRRLCVHDSLGRVRFRLIFLAEYRVTARLTGCISICRYV